MIKWVKGDDYFAKGADLKTFGITRIEDDPYNVPNHVNAVEIHSCEEDRDMILRLLQKGG
jgi:hypothetical protein